MAAEGVTTAVNESIKEAVLAAVREELAAHKEEVKELQHMLTAVNGELAVVKEELAVVKGDLAKHKEQWAESNKPLDVSGVRGNSRKRTQDMMSGFAREEEGTEVQELTRPRATECLAAGTDRQVTQGLKQNVDLKIRQSESDQKTAWRAIKYESQEKKNLLELQGLHGLSDDILAHVSTMTHLKNLDLGSSSGFSAEGIKHLYRLPRLECLNLHCTDVSDSALEGIGSLTSLTDLYLRKTKVTDAGLAHLTGLSTLRLLYLSQNKGVTNAGMVHVGKLTELEELSLDKTSVTDDGLRKLTALTKLYILGTPDGVDLDGEAVRLRIGI
ncbi:unnamed protein product [Closterium sp. Yama58-4]|nr:unnamed protein product [Closterium sp. Yama58-4]